MANKAKTHKINSNKKTHNKPKHEHKSLEKKIEHTHHPVHHEKTNLNFMLVMLVAVVALVSIIVMIVGTTQMRSTDATDNTGQVYLASSQANVNLAGTQSTFLGTPGEIYKGESFTAILFISEGTAPYTITSVDCGNGIVTYPNVVLSTNTAQYNTACSFTQTDTYTIEIKGHDSTVRSYEQCSDVAVTANVPGQTCTTTESSSPKSFTATWTVKVVEKATTAKELTATININENARKIKKGGNVPVFVMVSGGVPPYTVELYCGNEVINMNGQQVERNMMYRGTCTYDATGNFTIYAKVYDKSSSIAATAKVTGVLTTEQIEIEVVEDELGTAITCPSLVPPNPEVFCPGGVIVPTYIDNCVMGYTCTYPTPVARLSTNTDAITVGQSVTFTLSFYGGVAPYHDITLYCGDGTSKPLASTSTTTTGSCLYTTANTYTAYAIGYDSLGTVSRLTADVIGLRNIKLTSNDVTITVTKSVPTATLTASATSITEGNFITFTATFTGGVAPYHDVIFYCGDETTGTITSAGGTGGGSSGGDSSEKEIYIATCTYATANTYTAYAIGYDSAGAISKVTAEVIGFKNVKIQSNNVIITVTEQEFLVQLNMPSLGYLDEVVSVSANVEGGVWPYTLLQFTCGNENCPTLTPIYCKFGELIYYEADSNGCPVNPVCEKFVENVNAYVIGDDGDSTEPVGRFSKQCIYSQIGDYVVTVSVQDAEGVIKTTTSEITIVPQILRATLIAPSTAIINEEALVTVNALGGVEPYKYKILCGNEDTKIHTRATAEVVYVPYTTSNTKTCIYDKTGTYLITAYVIDTANAFVTVNTQILVVNPIIATLVQDYVETENQGRGQKVTFNLTIAGGISPYAGVTLICGNGEEVPLVNGTTLGLNTLFIEACHYNLSDGITTYAIFARGTDTAPVPNLFISNNLTFTEETEVQPPDVEEDTHRGGGGGGGTTYCTPSWTCTEWSTICMNTELTRICTDKYNCGSIFNKPIETLYCSKTSTTTSAQAQTDTGNDAQSGDTQKLSQAEIEQAKAKSAIWSILILAIVIACVLGIYFAFIRPHHEAMYSETERKLEDWVSAEETQGYGKGQLKEFLVKKGYPEKDIDSAIKRARPKAKAK